MKQIFLILMALTAFSCSKPATEIEPIYDFALNTAPSSTKITEGQTIEITCELHKSYFYSDDAVFTIATEQIAGSGTLTAPQIVPNGKFSIYYTAQGKEHHKIQIIVSDQFNNQEISTIQFTHNEQ